MLRVLNVVIINGGRGAAVVIPALLARQGLYVTSIVNAYDDGKSTGEIRNFFGMLGPSDIRKVQELMLPIDDPEYTSNLHIFKYRFPLDCDRNQILKVLDTFAKGDDNQLVGAPIKNVMALVTLQLFLREFINGLSAIEQVRGEQFNFADCSIMNCVYAGAFLACNRNIEQATQRIDKLFKLRGTVLPTSIEDKRLVALREDGQMLYSESDIVELRSNVRIERIYLLDKLLDPVRFDSLSIDTKRYYLERHHCYPAASTGVRLALQNADIIIYSAGTQHSSLYPTYLSTGVAESIADNNAALKVFMTNIGADYETPTYKASDYIRGAYRYLNLADAHTYSMQELFDVVFINIRRDKAPETYVDFDEENFAALPVTRIMEAFESVASPGKHDGEKVVQRILELYESRGLTVRE
jgi:2-phospho-L-lactate transferase/gluconeogenesis factor (CofD/UPF0052 family)